MREAFSDRMGATNSTFGISQLVAELVDEVWKHLPPPRPVVVYIVAPEIEPMRYRFPVQDLGEIPRRVRRFERALTCRDHDATVVLERLERPTAKPGQVPGGVVEEGVLVRVAAQIRGPKIVESAHADQSVEQIRTPEERIRRVKSAEAGTGGGDPLGFVADRRADVRNDLLLHVA